MRKGGLGKSLLFFGLVLSGVALLWLLWPQEIEQPSEEQKPLEQAQEPEMMVTYNGAFPYAMVKPRSDDVVRAIEKVGDGIMTDSFVAEQVYVDGSLLFIKR